MADIDFGKYNELVVEYIKKLKSNSSAYFKKQVIAGQVSIEEQTALTDSMQNIIYYLHYMYKQFPNEFEHIFNSIRETVQSISLLPIENRNIYGITQFERKNIFINPQFNAEGRLTGNERRALYIAHELGHVVNHTWMEKVRDYYANQREKGIINQIDEDLMCEGFSLLDEVTTQNTAENYIYSRAQKKRPAIKTHFSKKLFNGKGYPSNLDFYGELQEPAIMFARTLRGIGKENNDTKALDMLSRRAVSSDFFSRVLNEYTKDNQMKSLKNELLLMGLLKKASYANFGNGKTTYLTHSGEYLSEFKKVATRMRDYRDPYDDGHGGH